MKYALKNSRDVGRPALFAVWGATIVRNELVAQGYGNERK